MLASYLAAVAALALLTAVPGPDVAVVSRYALTAERRAAVRAAVGVVLGLVAWGALTVLGLAAVLAASTDAYTVVKLGGSAYLVIIGIMAVRRSRRHIDPGATYPLQGSSSPLRTGLLTNLLNPKIAVFYTSVLPSLVPLHAAPAVWLGILVATHVALSLGWLTACALVLSRSRSVLDTPRARRLLEAATGVVLIAFGLRVGAEAT